VSDGPTHVYAREEPADASGSLAVSFVGPPMTRLERGSLSVAKATLLDRRRAPAWSGQIQQYLVSIQARDGEDAVARVRAVLEKRGFSEFAIASG
jgi:hypothetical protein